MIQNRYFALLFRLGSLALVLMGILVQIGVFRGTIWFGSFMFYTIQSNLLAVFLFVLLFVRTFIALLKDGRHGSCGWFARFEMVCVVCLLVTFIVYWALLAPVSGNFNLWTFENVTTHGITPLLVLLDYILFTKARHLKYRDVYYAAIFPTAYVIFIYIAAWAGYTYNFGGGVVRRFPYFFLDVDQIGAGVIAYVLGILVFFLLLAHGMYFNDKKIRKV